MKSLNLPVPQIDLDYWCGAKGATRRDRQMAGKIFRARAKAYVRHLIKDVMSAADVDPSAMVPAQATLKLVEGCRPAPDRFEVPADLHYSLADLAETDVQVIYDRHGHAVAWTACDRLAA